MMRKPHWVFPRSNDVAAGHEVRRMMREMGLATVCESAQCPNRGECLAAGTVTFLILGEVCTRRCAFCAIEKGAPAACDPGAPRAVAEASRRLGLPYVVVTSVTRDDLPDGGASVFAAVIRAIRRASPETLVEVLIPDFAGVPGALETVLAAAPAVLNHNLETVPRLYPRVRPGADYERSLALLLHARKTVPEIATKSGLMVGLGEEPDEIDEVLRDLSAVGCASLTIGQYLQPGRSQMPVARYWTPEEFADLEERGRELGLSQVVAGPLVRSSYRAHETFRDLGARVPGGGGFRPASKDISRHPPF